MINQSVSLLNKRLEDKYGKFESGEANWRVVWSEDQFEWRKGDYEDRTPEGLLVRRVTETRYVPKYRQWIVEKWVLEGLIIAPVGSELTTKVTYEPIYGFPHHNRKPLIPSMDAVSYLIDGIHKKVGVTTGVRYKDPESTLKEALNVKEARLLKLEEELYGNETDVGDALAYKEAVGYTGPPKIASTIKEV